MLALFRLPLMYLARVFERDAWWLKSSGAILAGLWGYVAKAEAEQTAIYALFILMGLDLVTGIAASTRRGKKLSSKRLSDTGYKIVGYSSVIVATSAVERLVPGSVSLVPCSVAPLALTELVSLLENVRHLGVKNGGMLKRILEAALSHPDEEHPRGPQPKANPE